jgi:hypothetical protein
VKRSYTNCGTSYSGGKADEDIYFNGSARFFVEEIEVFQISK